MDSSTQGRNPGRFPEAVCFQAPRGLNAALSTLADQNHMTKSQVIRQALLREIADAGVVLADVAASR